MYIFCNLYNISSKTTVLANKLQEEALKKKSRFRQDLHYSKYFKNENVLRTSLKDTYRNGKFREGCSQSTTHNDTDLCTPAFNLCIRPCFLAKLVAQILTFLPSLLAKDNGSVCWGGKREILIFPIKLLLTNTTTQLYSSPTENKREKYSNKVINIWEWGNS